MTRHPWSTRLLRACLALWFVLAGGELGVVHECPMHGQAAGGAHSHSAAAPLRHAPAAMHHAAGPGVHVAPASGAPAPVPAHACTCVGTCSSASVAVTLAEAPTVGVEGVVDIAPPELPDVVTVPALRAAHVLPFGNGPPAGPPTA